MKYTEGQEFAIKKAILIYCQDEEGKGCHKYI